MATRYIYDSKGNYVKVKNSSTNSRAPIKNPAGAYDNPNRHYMPQGTRSKTSLFGGAAPVRNASVDIGNAQIRHALANRTTGTPAPVVAPTTTNPRGSTYRAPAVAAPAAVQPKIYTSEELAKLYGVNYDYDYILNLLNEGSARKRDEVLGQIERDRANSLRSGQGMFGQYLDALRKTKSNAVATGINKGTLAAQELMALLGTQDKLSETELMMNQLSQKTFDEYATAAGMNKSLAFDNSNAIKQYLGTLSSNLNANDVQRYAAELAAKAAAGGGGGGYSYSGGGSSGGSNGLTGNQYIDYLNFLESKGIPVRVGAGLPEAKPGTVGARGIPYLY